MFFIFIFHLKEHLEIVIRALREFIIDQNKDVLENVMSSMKKLLNFNETAIDHLHLALYSFQVSFCLFFKVVCIVIDFVNDNLNV